MTMLGTTAADAVERDAIISMTKNMSHHHDVNKKNTNTDHKACSLSAEATSTCSILKRVCFAPQHTIHMVESSSTPFEDEEDNNGYITEPAKSSQTPPARFREVYRPCYHQQDDKDEEERSTFRPEHERISRTEPSIGEEEEESSDHSGDSSCLCSSHQEEEDGSCLLESSSHSNHDACRPVRRARSVRKKTTFRVRPLKAGNLFDDGDDEDDMHNSSHHSNDDSTRNLYEDDDDVENDKGEHNDDDGEETSTSHSAETDSFRLLPNSRESSSVSLMNSLLNQDLSKKNRPLPTTAPESSTSAYDWDDDEDDEASFGSVEITCLTSRIKEMTLQKNRQHQGGEAAIADENGGSGIVDFDLSALFDRPTEGDDSTSRMRTLDFLYHDDDDSGGGGGGSDMGQ